MQNVTLPASPATPLQAGPAMSAASPAGPAAGDGFARELSRAQGQGAAPGEPEEAPNPRRAGKPQARPDALAGEAQEHRVRLAIPAIPAIPAPSAIPASAAIPAIPGSAAIPATSALPGLPAFWTSTGVPTVGEVPDAATPAEERQIADLAAGSATAAVDAAAMPAITVAQPVGFLADRTSAGTAATVAAVASADADRPRPIEPDEPPAGDLASMMAALLGLNTGQPPAARPAGDERTPAAEDMPVHRTQPHGRTPREDIARAMAAVAAPAAPLEAAPLPEPTSRTGAAPRQAVADIPGVPADPGQAQALAVTGRDGGPAPALPSSAAAPESKTSGPPAAVPPGVAHAPADAAMAAHGAPKEAAGMVAAPRDNTSSPGLPPPVETVSLPAAVPGLASGIPPAAGLAGSARTDAGSPTPAAPFEAQLSAALNSPEFAPALGHQLTLMVKGGVQQVRLHLNPAEMGPITVQIALDGGSAQVNLAAEQAVTRAVLEQAMPALAGALREGGLTLTGGGVFEQPREQARQPQRDGAEPGSQRDTGGTSARGDSLGADRAAPTLQRTLRGVVDLIA